MAFDFANALGGTAALDQIFDLSNSMKAVSAAIFGFSKSKVFSGGATSTTMRAMSTDKVTLALQERNLNIEKDIVYKVDSILDKLVKMKVTDLQNKTVLDAFLILEDSKLKIAYKSLAFLDSFSTWIDKNGQKSATALGNFVDLLTSTAKKFSAHKKSFENMKFGVSVFHELIGTIGAVGSNLIKLAVGLSVFTLSIWGLAKVVGAGGLVVVVSSLIALTGTLVLMNRMLRTQDDKSNVLLNLAKSMVIMSVSIIGLAIASVIFQHAGVKGFIMMIGTVALLAITIALSNKLMSSTSASGIKQDTLATTLLALSLGVLTLSIAGLIFEHVGYSGMLKVVIAVAALATIMVIANNLSRGTGGDFTKSLVAISISVAILALSIWLWNKLVPDPMMALAPTLAIGALVALLALVANRAEGMFKASLSLILASVSLIILAYAIKQFDSVSETALINAGLAVAGLTTALYILGSAKSSILGGAALMLGSISIVILASGLARLASVSPDTMLATGLFVGALSGVLIALGALPTSILGAGALLLGATAMVILGSSLSKFAGYETILPSIALGITALGASFALLGNPFTLPFVIAGAGVSLLIAGSVNILASGIAKLKTAGVTKEDYVNTSENLGMFISSMAKMFDDNAGNFLSVKLGVWALSDLGNLITSLASGIQSMARLQFVENGVKDGKIVPVSVRQLTDADFNLVGIGINKIINSVSTPLAAIGKETSGSWLFSSNPVSDGIKAVSGLGNLMSELAAGVQAMANLQFTEYGVRGNKVVPVAIRQLTDVDFTNVGLNLGRILTAVKDPLAEIGEGSSWLTSGPVKAGIDTVTGLGSVMSDIAKGVLDMANLQYTSYKIVNGKLVADKQIKLTENHFKQVGINFDKIITALKGPLAAIGSESGFFTDGNTANGIETLAKIGDVINPIVDLIKTFSALDVKNPELIGKSVGSILESLSVSLAKASKLTFDTKSIVAITESMSSMNKELRQFNKVVDTFDRFASSLEKINKQLSEDKFKKIMQIKAGIENLASGELSKKFEKLLEIVSEKMHGAVVAIERGVRSAGTQQQYVPAAQQTIIQQQSAVAQKQKATQEYNISMSELGDKLDEIVQLLGGTLKVKSSSF